MRAAHCASAARIGACSVLACAAWGQAALAAGALTPAPDRLEACIAAAAAHHRVNPQLLRAILKVESNLDPRALGRNRDGSIDVGIGQINSRHFPTLARYGLQPGHLLDGCVGAYVAAWHLAGLVAAHGNNWTAVARYHSATPALNRRYQLLLHKELLARGVLAPSPRAAPGIPVSSLERTRRQPDVTVIAAPS